MALTHTLTARLVAANRAHSYEKSYSADAADPREIAVPDSSTDLEVAIAIDVSALVSLFIVSDQDVTIETNDGTTPDDTISLVANVPLIWNADQELANPLSVDVTSIFITNSSGSAATVIVEVLQDSTP